METTTLKALISVPDRPRRASIEKALYAMARAETHPSRTERADKAKMVYADDRVVGQIIERGAAPIATTTGTGWASEVSQNLVGEFIATLAPLSAAAQIILQGLTIRMGPARGMKLPAREGAPSAATSWVGESDPIPARVYTVNDDCELSPRKFGFIIGISRELAKRANGEAVVRQLMREDAAASLDGAYFSTEAGDTAKHKGVLSGVSPVVGYGGGDDVAMKTDLVALSEVVAASGSGQVVFIVSPKRAARIRVLAPDLNRELTFLPSLAIADDRIIAVDPLSWAHGFGDDFDIEASEAATIHMSDDPNPIVESSVTADPVRSYWQTGSIALRLLADVGFAPRRPNAVAWLEGATW